MQYYVYDHTTILYYTMDTMDIMLGGITEQRVVVHATLHVGAG